MRLMLWKKLMMVRSESSVLGVVAGVVRSSKRRSMIWGQTVWMLSMKWGFYQQMLPISLIVSSWILDVEGMICWRVSAWMSW